MSIKITRLGLGMTLLAGAVLSSFSLPALASSHREAPFITELPKVDGTDFYMFRSYEPNRSQYVTLIANYVPLQDAYGGPNYFAMDSSAAYEIKIDNNGDAVEDIRFVFRFRNFNKDAAFPIRGSNVSIPLIVTGPGINAADDEKINRRESYTVDILRGRAVRSSSTRLTRADGGGAEFIKPIDNIGNKTIPNYPAYAAQHIYQVNIPGCELPGKVFAGQRKESFVVNLGETFDLINLNPVGSETGERNSLDDKNVTSLALEVPISCITNGSEPVIGGWTTASLPQTRTLNNDRRTLRAMQTTGGMRQVSRLGMPLVNEVVIGLKDKDRFNKSEPRNDVKDFGVYVIRPTLPVLVEALFDVPAPDFDRTDLVTVFATGLQGLNQPANVKPGEMTRLNTAIPPTPLASQDPLGVLNLADLAGFPNGRRPVDDVVDIELRVAMGLLCTSSVQMAIAGAGVDPGCNGNTAPESSTLAFTDGARSANTEVSDNAFPYLKSPIPGSPNEVAPD